MNIRSLAILVAISAMLFGCNKERRLAERLEKSHTVREAMPIAKKLAELRTPRSRAVLEEFAASSFLRAFDPDHDILLVVAEDGRVYYAYAWPWIDVNQMEGSALAQELPLPNITTSSVALFTDVSSYQEVWHGGCDERGCEFFLKAAPGEGYRKIWFRWDESGFHGISLFEATAEEVAASRSGI